MSRSEKRRSVGMMGLLIGSLLAGGIVLAVFSLVPHSVLQGEWPLGISEREVQRYAEVADLRRIEHQISSEPQGEPFYVCLSGEGEQPVAGWSSRWFEAQGYGDSVLVRPTPTIAGGYEIRFKDELPFRGQQGVIVSPATAADIRMKYAEVLAGELGLSTPAVGFVRMVSCGNEQPVHVVEEVIGEGFLARRRFSEAVLFKRAFDPDRPDQLFPEVIGDTSQAPVLRSMLALVHEDAERERLEKLSHTLDDAAATGWLLMHWLEGAPDPLYQENVFAFHWNRGRFTPMHRPSRIPAQLDDQEMDPWAVNIFTPWLKVPAFREKFLARRAELAARRPELERMFASVDSLWLPILANDAPSAEITATADRVKQEIFQRLSEGDPVAFLDRPMIAGPGLATLLQGQEVAKRYWPTESDVDGVQAIAQKYKVRLVGDSLIFPRGKYAVDEDLIIPQGYSLILLSGARLNMAPGRSILCQGALHVRGSRLNPVFVRPAGGAFGTLAVMGDGDTQCSIVGLQISGGAGARINGVQHAGMLSIQDAATTRFASCIFSAPAGSTALYVHGGEFEMDDCTMINSRVDLRDVAGTVNETAFQGGTRGAGNGGLGVNASTIRIENCRFWSISGNAFEAGDGSKVVVRASHFSQCHTAIAATDLSEVHLEQNTITGNRKAFSAQRVKPLYGGAKIFLYNNTVDRNATERVVDEHSSITVGERFDERVLEAVQ